MMNDDKFDEILNKISILHEVKNTDYGNAFGDTYQEFASYSDLAANGYALGLLKNKINRLTNLMLSQEEPQVNESIQDTLIDLASYSIMFLEELQKHE